MASAFWARATASGRSHSSITSFWQIPSLTWSVTASAMLGLPASLGRGSFGLGDPLGHALPCQPVDVPTWDRSGIASAPAVVEAAADVAQDALAILLRQHVPVPGKPIAAEARRVLRRPRQYRRATKGMKPVSRFSGSMLVALIARAPSSPAREPG